MALNRRMTRGTHGCRNVTISALAYLINYLDCQRSGRVMGGPTFFKVGDLFYKICPSHYANFRKKISSETSCGMSETTFYVIPKVSAIPQDVSDVIFFSKIDIELGHNFLQIPLLKTHLKIPLLI